MKAVFIIGTILSIISALVIAYVVYQYIQYRRFKKLYKNTDTRHQYLKSLAHSLYPLFPKPDTPRYIKKQKLINEAGWGISVERLYVYKYVALLLVMLVSVGIKATNMQIKMQEIITDLYYDKVVMEETTKVIQPHIDKEKELYEYFKKDIANNDEFYLKANAKKMQVYMAKKISAQGWQYADEKPDVTAKRLYNKLLAIRKIESNIKGYYIMLLIFIAVYAMPEQAAKIKIKLLSEKKMWEVVNLCSVYSIFGSMPPYSLVNVVDNMVIVADAFKHIIEELSDNIKNAKKDTVYKEILKKVDNDDLYDLIENMQLTNDVGLLDSVSRIDEMIENNLENIKVINISRRDSKNIYSMIPATIVLFLAFIYAAYGIVPLANPFDAINALNK